MITKLRKFLKKNMTVTLVTLSIFSASITMSCFPFADEGESLIGDVIQGEWYARYCEIDRILTYAFLGSVLTVVEEYFSGANCATRISTSTTTYSVDRAGEAASSPNGASKIDLTANDTVSCPTSGTCTTNSQNTGQKVLGIYKVEDNTDGTQRLSVGFSSPSSSPSEGSRPTSFSTSGLKRSKPSDET